MTDLRHHAALAAAVATLAGWGSPAAAAACNVSPQGVNFGGYDPLSSTPLDGVGNIAVTCDSTVSFTVSLSSGNGSYAERRLTGGASQLNYNLYSDATRFVVWGDGSNGSSTVSATGASTDIPVYGRAPASQNVPAATYTDTIIVTVTY